MQRDEQQSPGKQKEQQQSSGWGLGGLVSGVAGVVGAVGSTITFARDGLSGLLIQADHYLTDEAKEILLKPLAQKIKSIQSTNSLSEETSKKCDAMIAMLNLIIENDKKANWDDADTKKRVKELQQEIDGMRWLLHPEIKDEITRQIAEAVLECLQKIDPTKHLADKIYSVMAENCDESYCHWKALTLQTQSLIKRYECWLNWRQAQVKSSELTSRCDALLASVEQEQNINLDTYTQWKVQIENILKEIEVIPYLILQPESSDNLYKGWKPAGGQSEILRKLLTIENNINAKIKGAGLQQIEITFNAIKNTIGDTTTKNLSDALARTASIKNTFASEFDRYSKGDPIKFKEERETTLAWAASKAGNLTLGSVRYFLSNFIQTDPTKLEILRTANLQIEGSLNLETARDPNSNIDTRSNIINTWAYLQERIEKHENVVSESSGSKPPRRAAYLLHSTNLELMDTVNSLNVKQDTSLHQLVRAHVSYDDGMQQLLQASANPVVTNTAAKVNNNK